MKAIITKVAMALVIAGGQTALADYKCKNLDGDLKVHLVNESPGFSFISKPAAGVIKFKGEYTVYTGKVSQVTSRISVHDQFHLENEFGESIYMNLFPTLFFAKPAAVQSIDLLDKPVISPLGSCGRAGCDPIEFKPVVTHSLKLKFEGESHDLQCFNSTF